MNEHTHEWMRVNEESIVGGYFPIGWECVTCGESRDNNVDAWELSNSGVKSSKSKLIGIHGGLIHRLNGQTCKSQIYDAATNKLTYLK